MSVHVGLPHCDRAASHIKNVKGQGGQRLIEGLSDTPRFLPTVTVEAVGKQDGAETVGKALFCRIQRALTQLKRQRWISGKSICG